LVLDSTADWPLAWFTSLRTGGAPAAVPDKEWDIPFPLSVPYETDVHTPNIVARQYLCRSAPRPCDRRTGDEYL